MPRVREDTMNETLAEMHARHAREIAAIERGGCWRCGNAEQPGFLLLAGKGGALVPCPYCRPGKAAEWMADNAPVPSTKEGAPLPPGRIDMMDGFGMCAAPRPAEEAPRCACGHAVTGTDPVCQEWGPGVDETTGVDHGGCACTDHVARPAEEACPEPDACSWCMTRPEMEDGLCDECAAEGRRIGKLVARVSGRKGDSRG